MRRVGKNGADSYSKNGYAVTVLTRQSYCFFLKLSPFNANLDAVFTTLSKMASAAETLLSSVSYQFAMGNWLAIICHLFIVFINEQFSHFVHIWQSLS